MRVFVLLLLYFGKGPHLPWRIPKHIWDLYNDTKIEAAKHKMPSNNVVRGAQLINFFFFSIISNLIKIARIESLLINRIVLTIGEDCD